MNTEIRTQIYGLLNRAASVSSNLFWDQAPDDFDISGDYAIISEINTAHDRDTMKEYLMIDFQVSIYCEHLSDGEFLESEFVDLIKTRDQYLSFSNFSFIDLRLTNKLENVVDDKTRQLLIEATLELETS